MFNIYDVFSFPCFKTVSVVNNVGELSSIFPRRTRSYSLPSTSVSQFVSGYNQIAGIPYLFLIFVFRNFCPVNSFYRLQISSEFAKLSRKKPAFVQIDLLHPKRVFVSRLKYGDNKASFTNFITI